MNEAISPTNIHVDKSKNTIQFEWNNGEKHEIPLALLRNACPCAECRGGHDNMVSTPDAGMFKLRELSEEAVSVGSMELAGNYALVLTWGDGHSAGIYNWGYLWQLCQLHLEMDIKPNNE